MHHEPDDGVLVAIPVTAVASGRLSNWIQRGDS